MQLRLFCWNNFCWCSSSFFKVIASSFSSFSQSRLRSVELHTYERTHTHLAARSGALTLSHHARSLSLSVSLSDTFVASQGPHMEWKPLVATRLSSQTDDFSVRKKLLDDPIFRNWTIKEKNYNGSKFFEYFSSIEKVLKRQLSWSFQLKGKTLRLTISSFT